MWSLEKFNKYTYARKVNVVSDHKLLECILKKALANTPKRLQRMMMRLQKYHVDLMYVPGKNLHLADILSRAYRPITEGLHTDFEHAHVAGHVPISESRLEATRTATEAVQVMTALTQTILQGWPEECLESYRKLAFQNTASLYCKRFTMTSQLSLD